jgi:hypothetical protein
VPFVAYSQNYQLQQWGTNKGLYMSLHTAYSAAGASEVAGGSYARLATTWGTASGGSMALASTPYTFSVPASTTVAFLGFWDQLTTGNFSGMTALGGGSAYAFAAPSSTGVVLAPNSGYVANQPVVVFNTGGSSLPGGLTAGTIYYVITPASDSFSLSATSGGSAITLSTDGSGLVQAITTEAFVGAGQYVVNSGSWTLV